MILRLPSRVQDIPDALKGGSRAGGFAQVDGWRDCGRGVSGWRVDRRNSEFSKGFFLNISSYLFSSIA